MKGTLFAIKRYALHDGPNIRTTIFLKGCPLRCEWCHNPEGIKPEIEYIWHAARCIGCSDCISTCPPHALQWQGKVLVRDMLLCTRCTQCVQVCPALAHEATGWTATVDEVLAEIKKDLPFFDQSGGGVTFSGGEPLLQADFLRALLQQAGELGIHRAVDTTGFAPQDTLAAVAQHTDLFLFDLKHMDDLKHQRYTGVSNKQILSNLRFLAAHEKAVHIRFPFIPGVNDDEENIEQTGVFIQSLPGEQTVHVLPFHPAANAKYTKLGQHNPGKDLKSPDTEQTKAVVTKLKSYGLKVGIGG